MRERTKLKLGCRKKNSGLISQEKKKSLADCRLSPTVILNITSTIQNFVYGKWFQVNVFLGHIIFLATVKIL